MRAILQAVTVQHARSVNNGSTSRQENALPRSPAIVVAFFGEKEHKMSHYREVYRAQIEELVQASRLIGQRGLTSSVGGNLSYRVSETHLLVTPTNVPKSNMKPEYICILDYAGNAVDVNEGFAPTSETPFHTMIARERPDVMASVHAHCKVLSAFAITEKHWLELPIFPEPMMEIGPVITVPYVAPSSQRFAEEIKKYIHRSNGFLLQNHGALALSPVSPVDAVEKLYMMECVADSIYMAINMGTPHTLSRDEVLEVAALQKIKGLDGAIEPIAQSFCV